jgi:hypothetical protein
MDKSGFYKARDAARGAKIPEEQIHGVVDALGSKETDREVKRVLTAEKVTAFLNRVSGMDGESRKDSRAMLDIGNLLRDMKGFFQDSRKKIPEQEQKILNAGVTAVEVGLHDGTFAQLEGRSAAELAFVVNQLAKIKELPEHQQELEDFDYGALVELLQNALEFGTQYYEEGNENNELLELAQKELDGLLDKVSASDNLTAWHEQHEETMAARTAFTEARDSLVESGKIPELAKKLSKDFDDFFELAADFRAPVKYGDNDIIEFFSGLIYDKEKVAELESALAEESELFFHGGNHMKKGLMNVLAGKIASEYRLTNNHRDRGNDDTIGGHNIESNYFILCRIIKDAATHLKSERDKQLAIPMGVVKSRGSLAVERRKKAEGITDDVLDFPEKGFLQAEIQNLAKLGNDLYRKKKRENEAPRSLSTDEKDVFQKYHRLEKKIKKLKKNAGKESLRKKLQASFDAVMLSLDRPAGDLYLVKSVLVAKDIAKSQALSDRKGSKGENISKMNRPGYKSDFNYAQKTGDKGIGVHSFLANGNPRKQWGKKGKTFSDVHYVVSHMPIAEMVAKYTAQFSAETPE